MDGQFPLSEEGKGYRLIRSIGFADVNEFLSFDPHFPILLFCLCFIDTVAILQVFCLSNQVFFIDVFELTITLSNDP